DGWAVSVSTDKTGRRLYVPAQAPFQTDVSLSVFAINPLSGAPSVVAGSPFSVGPLSESNSNFLPQIIVAPSGRFAYVGARLIAGYSVDEVGDLTSLVDQPTTSSLFIAGAYSGIVGAFAIAKPVPSTALSTPVITWPTPASIVQGTPLGTTQLNATTNVTG